MQLATQLLIGGVAAGALLAPIAMGFSLILGVARFWHLAHGAVVAAAAYGLYAIVQLWQWPLWAAFLAAPLLSGLLGVGMNAVLYEPLRRRGVSAVIMLIASLGAFIAILNTLAILFTFDPRTIRHPFLDNTFHFRGFWMNATGAAALLFAFVAVGATSYMLYRLRWGTSLRAIMSSPEMSQVVGIDLRRARHLAFGWGSALAGPPALLIAAGNGIHPNAALTLVLLAAVATIVGGIGHALGASVGAVLITVLQFQAGGIVSSRWGPTIVFLTLIGFIVLRPTGLFGSRLWGSQV